MVEEEISGNVASIATHSLLKVDEDAEKLSKCKRENFLLVTAKLLFITKRGLSDLEKLLYFFYIEVVDERCGRLEKAEKRYKK